MNAPLDTAAVVREAVACAEALPDENQAADGAPGFTLGAPPPERDDDAANRLALRSPSDYDRVRVEEAARLGIRVSTLDEMVAKARGLSQEGHGRGVKLDLPDPWPEPVAMLDVLGEVVATVRRHVILPPETADAVALWIVHTWLFERFEHTPRLGITSPARQCGKSTLMDVLRSLCRKSLKADNISASGVFRTVEALSPMTLLIDEADTFLAESDELRGILNSGFEQSGQSIRVVEVQGEHQPIQFRTFTPVALAAIGTLPPTLEDRAIPIRLQRKGAGETVEKFRENDNRGKMETLARKLARCTVDVRGGLMANPAMPPTLGDREADICVPLVAIADCAGGDWPRRGRAALLAMFGRRAEADGNSDTGGKLLADLRTIFAEGGASRMTSADLCAKLGAMEDRPWPEWRHGKPMTPAQLANALRPFAVRPQNMKMHDGSVPKGYYREHFAEAWNRYLPPTDTLPPRAGGSKPLPPLPDCNSKENGAFEAATKGGTVAEQDGVISELFQSGSGGSGSKPLIGERKGYGEAGSASFADPDEVVF